MSDPAGLTPGALIAAHFVDRFPGPAHERERGFTLDVSFQAPARGITALFGPSGCGKTTVLRCLAGLHRPAQGTLMVGAAPWQDDHHFLPPHRRPVGYVFQEASLFPHLSVRSNLLYGYRRTVGRGQPETIKVDDVIELLGIAPLLERSVLRLSGGERQRVAIGRALLAQPRLLLMDEPMAALDRLAKDEILPYLEALHDQLAIPAVYVSHDLAEVERLADYLVLIEQGRVVAAGPLEQVQADPALVLARQPEAGVTLNATVVHYDPEYALTRLAVDGGRLMVPGRLGELGRRRRVRLTASDVNLARRPAEDSTLLNLLPALIVATEPFDPAQITVALRLGAEGEGAQVLARITRKSWDQLQLAPGEVVYAQIKGVALVRAGR